MIMDTTSARPSPEMLRKFFPLRSLDTAQLELLARSVIIEQVAASHQLMKRGSLDDYSFFLLEGHLRLRAEDGRVSDVQAQDPAALSPIAQLLPRHYDVVSVSMVRFLRIENSMLQNVSNSRGNKANSIDGYLVSGEQEEESSDFENQLSYQFIEDLEKDRLVLPSLPEVAIRISKALEDNVSDAGTIAAMIQTDPVITAKLIKAANSALYGRSTPVETCTGSVIRLGSDVTHKLVLSYSLRELFCSKSALLHKMMKDLWKHSTKVGAICYVLATHNKRFNPEHAMLIGLLHDIGVVALLNYANDFPDEVNKPGVIDQAIRFLRAQTGSLILRKWGFPMEFVVSALEGEEWMRDKSQEPDYCDLVIIAQLHSFIGTKRALSVPAIDGIPAYKRLALGELTPKSSLKILNRAKDQIARAESLLNI